MTDRGIRRGRLVRNPERRCAKSRDRHKTACQKYHSGQRRPDESTFIEGSHSASQNVKISRSAVLGEVLELADRHDLGLTKPNVNIKHLLNEFLASRRQGLSPHTIAYYRQCLTPLLMWHELTPQSITEFLAGLPCNAGGKLAYYRATRAFCNWLVRNDYIKDSPLKKVDPPKPPKPILPSLTREQVDYLIAQVGNVRDKAIISMFFDSGMRLNELVNVKVGDIDWEDYTVTIWGKGNKQRKAPFAQKTAGLLRESLSNDGTGDNVWGIGRKGVETMLANLRQRTGLPCNPHSFRRGFACNLHREGLSTLDIMHLGGWQDLSMVLRYTRSITFDDCLKHYRAVLNSHHDNQGPGKTGASGDGVEVHEVCDIRGFPQVL